MFDPTIYIINFRQLILWVLPTYLRKANRVAWLEVLFAPLQRIYNQFIAFREVSNYKVFHNSQIILMEKLLNDSFDVDLRRIEIKNAVLIQPIYFYEEADHQPVHFYEQADQRPVFFREESDFIGSNTDFYVLIPSDILPSNTTESNGLIIQINAKIEYYKLYSKNYEIQWTP